MKILIYITLIAFLSGCSLSPGMHMETKRNFGSQEEYVFIESLGENIVVENINNSSSAPLDGIYKIGKGDQIAMTVWGLEEIFKNTYVNEYAAMRTVDENGFLYIPYAGLIKAVGLSQNELRNITAEKLSKYFNDPQIDISIAKFNSQKIYVIGEVNQPQRINLTNIPLTLSDAIGEVKGLNNNTSKPSEIFIIRKGINKDNPRIFIADISSPSGFIDANEFYLHDNDIIYVNSSGTARWNRVISQFFPFSSLLNSIDNLTAD